MNPLLILFLIIGAGQLTTEKTSGCFVTDGVHCAKGSGAGDAVPQGRSAVAGTAPDSKAAPLKCGKYEHIEHYIEGMCGPSKCGPVDVHSGDAFCSARCIPPPADKCAPDQHTVTEKEWRELMERLKRLEAK